jgi:CDP-diacylglycerol--serine O-phosphatidyltransferase
MSYIRDEGGLDVSLGWLLPALLIPCAAAYRLAKFNLDKEQQYGFKGVPTPAVGLLIASIPLIYWYGDNESIVLLLLNKWFLYGLVIVLSYLMVSNLPLMSLKFADYSLRNNISKIILAIASILLIVLLKWLAIPIIFVAYIILSLFSIKGPSRS